MVGLATDVQETNDKCKRTIQSMEEQLVAQDKAAAIKDAKINEQDLEIQ